MRNRRILPLILFVLIFVVSLSCVSASDTNNSEGIDEVSSINQTSSVDINLLTDNSSNTQSDYDSINESNNAEIENDSVNDDADDIGNSSSDINRTYLDGKNSSILNGNNYTIILKDENNQVIGNQSIIFNLNGDNFTSITNSDGIASFTVNLPVGQYNLTYSYLGSDVYAPSNGSSTITVYKKNTFINASDLEKSYVANGSYIITLKDEDGNPLIGQVVYISINGKNYVRVTDSNGQAKLRIRLYPSTYNITTRYEGNTSYNGSKTSNVIVVNKSTTEVTAGNLTKNYADEGYYVVNLKDMDGNPLVNQSISIEVSGKAYFRTTDSNGQAKLRIRLYPGNYTITTTYDGSRGYNSSTINSTVIVNKSPSYIVGNNLTKIYGYNDRFIINLSSDVGSLSGRYVNFVLSGKTYRLKTNENGTASIAIRLAPGNYSAYYYFDGDREYSGSNASNNVNIVVLKNSASFLTDNLVMNYSNGSFIIKLVDLYGNPISGKNITLTINNKNYYRITNSSGQASLKINLHCGEYNIRYTYNDSEFKYLKASGNSNITVLGTNTTLTSNNYTIKYNDSTITYEIKYATANGTTIANKTITVQINGKTYKPITHSNGVAKVNLNLSPGVYTMTYSIKNNKGYYGANGTSIITIKGYKISSSSYTTYAGTAFTYSVTLTDENNDTVANKVITFTINNKKYTATTNSKGVASIKLNLSAGQYNITFHYAGDNYYNPVNSSNIIYVKAKSIDTSSISALAKSLTIGLTSDYDKAVALFNWVRDNISYSYYYNSQQGAAKTLKLRSGNCCDQSNLYVALCRQVGLTVRYVHGYCHFSDGWYGHVWAEVKIGNKWYSADCVSTRNTFGTINNWNTATATIYNRYTNLPF